MKKFLALLNAPLASFDRALKMPKEDMGPAMEAWNTWMAAHKKDLIDPGAPVGKSMKVTPAGAEKFRNQVGGYMVVQAKSLEEAAKLFGKGHPHYMLENAWVEVTEILPMDM